MQISLLLQLLLHVRYRAGHTSHSERKYVRLNHITLRVAWPLNPEPGYSVLRGGHPVSDFYHLFLLEAHQLVVDGVLTLHRLVAERLPS